MPPRSMPVTLGFTLAGLLLFGPVCQQRQDEASAAEPPESGAAGTPVADPSRVRPSPLAGTWYEADRDALHRQIHQALDAVDPHPGQRPLALVCPHAGFAYSGATAAWSYKTLEKERYDRVFILGPAHHVPLQGLGIGPWTHYETPLGRVPIDGAAVERLTADDLVTVIEGVDAQEHSVEMQVPFLQTVAMGSRIVPIVVGELDLAQIRHAAKLLRDEVGPGDLVVVSTDFTHWGARFGYQPAYDDLPAGLEQLDMGAFEALAALDEERWLAYRKDTGATICGFRAVAIVAAMLPDEAAVTLRHYSR